MRKCPLLVLLTLLIAPASLATEIPTNARSTQALSRVQPALTAELKALGADWGAPLYLRIFKASDELEVWVDTGEASIKWRASGTTFFTTTFTAFVRARSG